jgi:hypothetical protein
VFPLRLCENIVTSLRTLIETVRGFTENVSFR